MGTATWGTFALASVIAMLVIGLPGTLIGLSLRLRGLWLAAAAPLLGMTTIVLASVWTAMAGVRWAWWAVAATAVGLAILAFAFTLIAHSGGAEAPPVGWRWATPIAIGIGILLLTVRFTRVIGEPDWFVQNGDGVFHLNAVRWILDHGDASPFALLGIGSQVQATFYPDVWHAVVSLVCQVTGAAIPVATNAVLFSVACIIWPLGGVLLARTIFGARTPLVIAAGALSAGFGVFPFMLIPYMGTYPLILGIALTPAILASLIALVGPARVTISRRLAIALFALSLPGLGDAHPSAVIMLAVLAFPVVCAGLWSLARARRERRRMAVLLAVLYGVAVLALIVLVRPFLVQPNAARSTPGQAIGELLTGGLVGTPMPLALSALAIVGMVAALRRGAVAGWMAAGLWLVLAVLYLAAVGPDDFWRLLLAQPWYSDASRVAAFAPITILPLAALGADRTWMWAVRLVDFDAHPRRRRIAEFVAIALLGAVVLQSGATRADDRFARTLFTPTDNQLMANVPLSADDRALLARLPRFVPADAIVAGDPWTGASLAYALAGRRALVPYMLAPITAQAKELFDGLATSASDGSACRAARELGVDWVLELHGGRTLPGRPQLPGMKGLNESANVELVDRVGNSSLFKITGCDVP